MAKDDFSEYDFVDRFTRSLAKNIPIDTSEMMYLLEVKKQEYVYIALLSLGFLGIAFLALLTYWM